MASNLQRLSNIISNAVRKIDDRCSVLEMTFLSLDEPICLGSQASDHQDPIILEEVTKLLSASMMLIATAKAPTTYIFNATCMYYLSATLRVATETHVAEILREAGPQGLHVDEIGAQNGVDPKKLARVLRYLSVHHIFKEVTPDVFALNRHASVMDTGKTLDMIKANPLRKYDDTSGVSALIGHCTDEDFKGAAYILEHLTNPDTAYHDNPNNTPLTQAFNYDRGVWSWFEEPDNIMRLKRFGCAMKGVSSMQPSDAILKGYPWSSLPSGTLVVDVGGGIGISTMHLAKSFPTLKFIVQDRPAVVKEGLCHWKDTSPEALLSGQVTFQEHDFFEAQPITKPRVFLLKQISHDWADSYLIRVLRKLRDATCDEPQENAPTTELVIIDCIVSYACSTSNVLYDMPGLPNSESLPPLLPNYIDADPSIYYTDLSMLVHFNSQERTIRHLDAVLRSAGWRITRVFASGNQGYNSQIVAQPT